MPKDLKIWGMTSVLMWGCSQGDTVDLAAEQVAVQDSVVVVENPGPTWERVWRVSDAPDVRIGNLSRGPEYALYRVTAAVELSDGRVVVANSGTRELKWFSSTGEFLVSAGREGQGPGEFLQMNRLLHLPEDSVAVSDFQQRRLTVFGPSGELARSVRLGETPGSAIPISRFADRSYLMVPENFFPLGDREPVRVERWVLNVERFSEESVSTELLASLPGREFMIVPNGAVRPDGSAVIARQFRTFGRHTVVVGNDSLWVVGDNDRPELQFRYSTGSTVLIARWAAPQRPVTTRDLEAVRDQALTFAADPPARQRIRDAWDRHPEPHELMPAFAPALFLDREGNAWVKEYAPPHEEDANRYFVLSSAGLWLGSVTLPEGLRILHVGTDRLIGLVTDELGVESVVVHSIIKPEG